MESMRATRRTFEVTPIPTKLTIIDVVADRSIFTGSEQGNES